MHTGSFKNWDVEEARKIINGLKNNLGALLPILHELQFNFGHVHKEAIPLIAESLNISRADVYGVLTFYHDFRTEPPGKNIVKICQAEACQAMGSRALTQHAGEKLGIGLGKTDSAGEFTLEAVYCLGNCACTPSIMINDKVYGKVDKNKFNQLVDSIN